MVTDSLFRASTDGGGGFRETEWRGDSHDIWIDLRNPELVVRGVTTLLETGLPLYRTARAVRS
jgi:hypothetical protein